MVRSLPGGAGVVVQAAKNSPAKTEEKNVHTAPSFAKYVPAESMAQKASLMTEGVATLRLRDNTELEKQQKAAELAALGQSAEGVSPSSTPVSETADTAEKKEGFGGFFAFPW
jgi:hypothetical protein